MGKHIHLRDKLRNEQELPENLSWDKMEEGILTSFDSKYNQELIKASSKFTRAIWISSIISAVAIMVLFQQLYNKKRTSQSSSDIKYEQAAVQNINEVSQTKSSPLIKNQNNSILNNDKNESQSSFTLVNDSDNNKEIIKTAELINHITTRQKSIKYQTSKVNGVNNSKQLNESIATNNKSEVQLNSHAPFNPKQINEQNENPTLVSQSDKKNKNGNNLSQQSTSKLLEPVFNIKTRTSKLITVDSNLPKAPSKTALSGLTKPLASKKRIALEVGSGVTFLIPRQNNPQNSSFSRTSESGILSNGYQLQLSYLIGSSWKLSTGLAYSSYKSKFDFYQEIDSLIEFKDVTTQIVQNRLTNEIIEIIKEDLLLNEKTIHNIRHYNQYTMFSIPIVLSKEWNIDRKLLISTGLGLNYSFNAKSDGRSVIGEIENSGRYEVSPEETNDLFDNSFISLLSELKISYDLSDTYFVSADLNIDFQLSDWSTNNIQKMNPIGLSNNLSIGMRF